VRLLVTANLAPFFRGGAEYHIAGTVRALRGAGHEVELLRFPFTFHPEASIERLMTFVAGLDLAAPNGMPIDRVVSLQFPGYGVQHPDHVVWLMHQHRAVYELYPQGDAPDALARLREAVVAFDTAALGRVARRYANSANVARRLARYNGLDATPLYHPPPFAGRYLGADAEPYVFYPARLERLKRQDLVIEAARHLRSPLVLLLAGEGGQADHYRALVARLGLEARVRFLGHISEAEKIAFYARAFAVFNGSFDEDYGYVTLEAMLASKPVLTCTDSGGPLELVAHAHTGWVVPPQPEAIAEALDRAYADPQRTRELGRNGRERYLALGITWEKVVDALTAKPSA
jgi:glycosyltransferase involved in cell wall biosynthesis